mgnify:CR=1 FL=1
MFTRVNYNVKKIATGYIVEYWMNGQEQTHAFETWQETLGFLKNNPPKVLEEVHSTDYYEVEEIA